MVHISTPIRMPRRGVLLAGGGAVMAVAVGAGGLALAGRDRFAGEEMDPQVAFDAARTGDVLLIDIRRPDEWTATGIPEGAEPIDLRRADFADAVLKLAGGDRTRRVALICAAGVRSDRTGAALSEAGFTRVIDLPEGILGSPAGPGWQARGLPVTRR